MENESYWQHTITLPKYPQINKNCNYDVVIVGGGISGVSLAYRLNNSNLKVALFESDTLGILQLRLLICMVLFMLIFIRSMAGVKQNSI